MALVDPAGTSGDEDVLTIVKSDSMMNNGMELALFTFAKSSASRMPSRDSSKVKIVPSAGFLLQQRIKKGVWYMKRHGMVSCDCATGRLCRVAHLVVSGGSPRAAQLTQLSCLEQVCLQCIWESDCKSNHTMALFRWNSFSGCGE